MLEGTYPFLEALDLSCVQTHPALGARRNRRPAAFAPRAKQETPQDQPARLVPTTVQVNKASLQSRWWSLQARRRGDAETRRVGKERLPGPVGPRKKKAVGAAVEGEGACWAKQTEWDGVGCGTTIFGHDRGLLVVIGPLI